MNISSIIKNLEKRFDILMDMKESEKRHVLAGIHDYVLTTREAITISPSFYKFDHEESDKFRLADLK